MAAVESSATRRANAVGERPEEGAPQGHPARPDPARTALAKTGLAAPVLVLNRSFQPVRITTARHGFTLLYLGRARALDRSYEPHDFAQWASLSSGLGPSSGVSGRPSAPPSDPGAAPAADEHDEFIGTPRGRIRVPRVLLLSGYNRVPQAPLRLSRRNIFLRDGFTCQYCARRPGTRELNLDHVMPRSRGGRSTWENLVTSCRDCNVRKGWATPEEAGMLLRSRPARPGWSTALVMAAPSKRYVEWEPFLGGIDTPHLPADDGADDDGEADAAEE